MTQTAVRKTIPKELGHFKAMHYRVYMGVVESIQWPLTLAGFNAFLKYVGPRPAGDKRIWSIGRKDHSRGYIKGNCGWQLMAENGAEASSRRWQSMTPEQRKKVLWTTKLRLAHLRGRRKVWRDPEFRKRQAAAASAAAKRLWRDPTFRQKVISAASNAGPKRRAWWANMTPLQRARFCKRRARIQFGDRR